MSNEQALSILTEAVSGIRLDRKDWTTVNTALDTLQKAIMPQPQSEKAPKDDKEPKQ